MRAPVELSIDNRRQTATVVAFSGLAPRNHLFEWTAAFTDFPANFIGVRDPYNRWYQDDPNGAAEAVLLATWVLGTRWLACVGGSAGGFAALMFGKLLAANRVVAFCPQSACGAAKRDLGDHRWDEWCLATPSADLGGLHERAIVHYALDDALDAMHANRLDAEQRRWPLGGHEVPQMLKVAGGLHGALMEALS